MPDFSDLEQRVFSTLQERWYDGFDSILARDIELKRLSSECMRLANVVTDDDFLKVVSYKEEIDRQRSLLEDVKIATQEVIDVPFSINVANR